MNSEKGRKSSNVGCTSCINKDLMNKKVMVCEENRKKDEERVKEFKRKLMEKEEKEKNYRKNINENYRRGLDQQLREHSEQKLKIKERSVREDEEIINIMKSEVLRVEQREER